MRNWLKHWWKDYTDLKLFELVIVCVLLLVLFLVDKIFGLHLFERLTK